jgi:hypothetical protein
MNARDGEIRHGRHHMSARVIGARAKLRHREQCESLDLEAKS